MNYIVIEGLWNIHTLEAPLEHMARTRPVTERVRHLEVLRTTATRLEMLSSSTD